MHSPSREIIWKSILLIVASLSLQELTVYNHINKTTLSSSRTTNSVVHDNKFHAKYRFDTKPNESSRHENPKLHKINKTQQFHRNSLYAELALDYIGDIRDIDNAYLKPNSTNTHNLEWYGHRTTQEVKLPLEVAKHVNFNQYGANKLLRKDKILMDNFNTIDMAEVWQIIHRELNHGFGMPFLKLDNTETKKWKYCAWHPNLLRFWYRRAWIKLKEQNTYEFIGFPTNNFH